MTETNAGLSQQFSDAIAAEKSAQGTKQWNLFNNRKETNRIEEEDISDGTPPCTGDTAANMASGTWSDKVRRHAKGEPDGNARFDKVVEHPMEENMMLPQGARLLQGMMWY